VALRYFVALLMVLCEAGCATAPHASFEWGNSAGHGRRVLLKDAEVQLCEMHVGPACEARPEWVAAAQPLLQQALVAELTAHGVEVVTDPAAGADYVLTVVLKDHFASSGLVASRTAFVLLLMPVVVVFGAEGMMMGGSSSPRPFGPSVSARLEDAISHEIVWTVLYTHGVADARSSDGAAKTSRLVLKELL
jgi:hypothetical protein